MSYVVMVIDTRSTAREDRGEVIPGFADRADACEVAARITANGGPFRHAVVRLDTAPAFR